MVIFFQLNSNIFPGMLSLGEAIRAQNKNSMANSIPQLRGSDQVKSLQVEKFRVSIFFVFYFTAKSSF